jgi:hypothetical protein
MNDRQLFEAMKTNATVTELAVDSLTDQKIQGGKSMCEMLKVR